MGVADLPSLVGKDFHLDVYRTVPHFFFIGDQDDNDAVVYRDGFEESDEKLIFELFGDTPVSRWPVAEKIYKSINANSEFRCYSGVGHKVTVQMNADISKFISQILADTKN